MRICVQRVAEAAVDVDGQTVGAIESGLLVLFGAHQKDRIEQIPWLAAKLVNLRIFTDSAGKMNLSLLDIKGSALIVSQFTLYGDCKEGRRPSFSEAAPPDLAKSLYEAFIAEVKKSQVPVEMGVFGAHMKIRLINDGPVTLIIDAP